MCMHAEMAETRRRRGWRLSFVFVFLLSFCTTTCQVDRVRSAGVCAKRSNWRRKCRSVVCVWEGVCGEGRRAHCFFLSFAKFLRVRRGALKQFAECSWKFFVEIFWRVKFSSKGGDSCCSMVYLTKVRRTGVQKDLRCWVFSSKGCDIV
jgi:hypothetical protein